MGCDHTIALDPDLLCEILKRVPELDRLRNVPLVSLRLSQACRDPAIWPHFNVHGFDSWTEAHWCSFLRWLVPRASGLQTLRFNDTKETENRARRGAAWTPRAKDLLSVLSARAPQLRTLVLRYPPSARENDLCPCAEFPLADLTNLSQLTSLTLGVGRTTIHIAPLVTALRGLPALEHLGLTSTDCPWEECIVSIATSCPQLTCLRIGFWSGKGFMRSYDTEPLNAPGEIGLLTNLVELSMDRLHLCSLPDSISKLTSLQRLLINDYDDIFIALPSSLTACRQLSQLRIASDEASPVLADLKSLRQLEIVHCVHWHEELPVPHEAFWPRLSGLTELKLVMHGDFLEGLVGMTGLRKLIIEKSEAADLPKGPYLNALESIRLHMCDFGTGLFSTLAAATKLRHVDLTYWNLTHECPEQLFHLLESLQALETLQLVHRMNLMSLAWKDAFLQYKVRCVAQGRCPVAIMMGIKLLD